MISNNIEEMEIWKGMKDAAVATMKGVTNKIGDVRDQMIESTTNWAHDKNIPFEGLNKYFRNQEANQRRMSKTQEYRRRYSGQAEQFGSSTNLLQNVIDKERGLNCIYTEDAIEVPAARRLRKSSAPDILINSCVSRHNLLSTYVGENRKLAVSELARKPSISQLESTWSRKEKKLTSPCPPYRRQHSYIERSLREPAPIEYRRQSAPVHTKTIPPIWYNTNNMKAKDEDSSTGPRVMIDSITDVELGVNQIQLTIHHEHKPNLLIVTIHRVRIPEDMLAKNSKIFATVNITSSKSQKKKSRSINCKNANVWEAEFSFKKMTIADLEESSVEVKIYRKMKFPKSSLYHSQTTVALCDVDLNDFVTTTKDLKCLGVHEKDYE